MLFINTSSDDVAELTEQFKVMIEVPDSVTMVMAGDPDTAVVTITDDDGVCVCVCVCVYSSHVMFSQQISVSAIPTPNSLSTPPLPLSSPPLTLCHPHP